MYLESMFLSQPLPSDVRIENAAKALLMSVLQQSGYQAGQPASQKGDLADDGPVIQFNDLFKSHNRKRIEDGLPFKKAVLATCPQAHPDRLCLADPKNAVLSSGDFMIVD
jgi:hypothetical protein